MHQNGVLVIHDTFSEMALPWERASFILNECASKINASVGKANMISSMSKMPVHQLSRRPRDEPTSSIRGSRPANYEARKMA